MTRATLPVVKKQTSKAALALLPDIELPFDTDQFGSDKIATFLRAVFFGMSIDDAQDSPGSPQLNTGIGYDAAAALVAIPRRRSRRNRTPPSASCSSSW